MSEKYIRIQDAVDATWEQPSYTDPLNVLTEVRDRINNLPSADVAPIVFCIDCMYHRYDKVVDEHWCNHGIMAGEVTPDFYCAYGKREG